jgi:hypothetical protein
MELFAFAGISNSTILLTAAAVMAIAATISVVLRSLGLSPRSELANRVDRLEMRTASAGDYRAVISLASDILSGVDTHGAPHIVEMFEEVGTSNARFARRINSGEAAYALLNELKAGIEIAAATARPIQNMIENGSIEIRAERTRLTGDLRKQVAAIRTPTWDRHGATILAAGMPSAMVSTIVTCFGQMNSLKTSALALTRSSSVDAFAGVLSQAATILASARQSVDLFQGGIAEPVASQSEHTGDAARAEELVPDVVDANTSAEAQSAHGDVATEENGASHSDNHDRAAAA